MLAGLAVLILYPAPHNITIGVTVSLVSVLFYVARNFLIPTARTLGPLDLIVSGYLLPVFFIQIRVDNQLIFGRISSSEYFWISSPTPGSYLALSVTDTGPRHGMGQMSSLRFLALTLRQKNSGHGPGLSRVQGITSFHNAALEQTRLPGITPQRVAPSNTILVDYTMAGMNGRETLAAIRSTGCKSPAILCSGYISNAKDGAYEDSFDGFLQKPFRHQEREKVLAQVTHLKGPRVHGGLCCETGNVFYDREFFSRLACRTE